MCLKYEGEDSDFLGDPGNRILGMSRGPALCSSFWKLSHEQTCKASGEYPEVAICEAPETYAARVHSPDSTAGILPKGHSAMSPTRSDRRSKPKGD